MWRMERGTKDDSGWNDHGRAQGGNFGNKKGSPAVVNSPEFVVKAVRMVAGVVDAVWCDAGLDVGAAGGEVSVLVAVQLDDATSAVWLLDGESFGKGDDEPVHGADGFGGGDVARSRRWGLRHTRRRGVVATLGDGYQGAASMARPGAGRALQWRRGW